MAGSEHNCGYSPNAKIEDVNKDSLYRPAILDGIKLLSGKDIVNIYRTATADHTTIEIFKCGS